MLNCYFNDYKNYNMEGENKKNKKSKQKLSDHFKQQCSQSLKRDPPIYLLNCLKDKSMILDLDLFNAQDIPFFTILVKLPITKIHLFCQQNKKANGPNSFPIYESSKFRDLLKDIAQTLIQSHTLKSLIFQKVPLKQRYMAVLKQSIGNSQCLKQLSFTKCELSDKHLSELKGGIAKNQSLVILDLSNNKLSNVGSMIGKIMSDHSTRRDELIWIASIRGEELADDLSKKGICEVNLQNNQLNDKSALELISFLKDDQWSRCINLRNNKLQIDAIKQFARLMKKNSTIISLDLRGNPGFTKQYSFYILKKLKQNIEKYKQQKEKYQSGKLKQRSQVLLVQNKNNQHKSLEQSRKLIKSKKSQILQFNLSNNLTVMPKSGKNILEKQQPTDEQYCKKCRQKTSDMLKLYKTNLDLQLEIKKLKYIILTKNIDVSVILPPPQSTVPNQIPINQSFNRAFQLISNTDNDDDVIGRVQQIMLELTKIMQNMDAHQTTQINYSNHNISQANSLSRTIPLFAANQSQMEELEESSIQEKSQQNTGGQSTQRFIN